MAEREREPGEKNVQNHVPLTGTGAASLFFRLTTKINEQDNNSISNVLDQLEHIMAKLNESYWCGVQNRRESPNQKSVT